MDAFFHRRLAGSAVADEMVAKMRGTPNQDSNPPLLCECGGNVEISEAVENPEYPGNWRFTLRCQQCGQEVAFWGQAACSGDGRFHCRLSPDVNADADATMAPFELRYHEEVK